MALIKCPNCGQMISDKAKACPKCGEPVRIIDRTSNESFPRGQSYSRQDSSIIPTQKKTTSPALITTIALLTLAVLTLGGFVFYKVVYEPSRLVDQSDQEVLIDMSDNYTVDTTEVIEEQTGIVQEDTHIATDVPAEEPAEAAADYVDEASTTYPKRFKLSGNMAGFPMTIKVFLENGYPGKCSGIYQNIKYKTKMNLSGSFEGGQLRLIGYADGTSYTFNLSVEDYGYFNGYCETGNGKTLNVSLEKE